MPWGLKQGVPASSDPPRSIGGCGREGQPPPACSTCGVWSPVEVLGDPGRGVRLSLGEGLQRTNAGQLASPHHAGGGSQQPSPLASLPSPVP